MKDKNFKLELFRFIDVFPTLTTNAHIRSHIEEYFKREDLRLPSHIRLGLLAATEGLTSTLAIPALKKNIHHMAKIFISGENTQDASKNLEKIWNSGIACTIDLLGEKAVSEKEALEHQKNYIELIEKLSELTPSWKENKSLDFNHEGRIPRNNISVKISALNSQISPVNYDESVSITKEKIRPIFRKAQEKNCTVYLDMEHYQLKNLTLSIFKSLMEESEFSQFKEAGIVLQAYLKDTEEDLKNLINFCQEKNKKVYVRLVKGAYWDAEQIWAGLNNWSCPVYLNKEDTDANYEKLSLLILENHHFIKPAFASHNIRSLSHAIIQARHHDLPQTGLEIQMLWGMAEPIKKALVSFGYRIRDYVPIGELVPGMAYLVRRLLENTSNESFLRQSFSDIKEEEKLLKKPGS